MTIKKVGFGGGCHWCTEAYFQSLKGVEFVEQGWANSEFPENNFSEAVIVHYNPAIIPLEVLIALHLHTHSSTKDHAFRKKYRSAVYVFDGSIDDYQKIISDNQKDFQEEIITKAIIFSQFKLNIESQLDYYTKNKDSVFCQRYISPKLEMIQKEFGNYYK